MPAVWLTDWLQVVSAIGSLLSGLGLIGVLGSFIFLIKQTRAVQNTSVATAYQGIVSAGTTVNNLYLQYPDLMPLLRNVDPLAEGAEWEPGHDDPRLVMIAAQTLDYFELILVTMAAFPRRLQDEWRDYIVGQFRRQRYLYRVVVRTDWYTEELRELAHASKNAGG
jgi:hypothetical protein